MVSPSKKEARLERLELLSSTSSTALTSAELKPVDNSLDSEVSIDSLEKPSKTSASDSPARKLSTSPLRFRDRLSQFFGGQSPKKAKPEEELHDGDGDSDVEESLRGLDSRDSTNYPSSTTDANDVKSDHESMNTIGKTSETASSKEEREYDEILRLREVIKQEDKEEKEDTVHDCSSAYAEETYLNTIRNQDIPTIQQEVPRGRKHLDLPVSRLFLKLFPEQESLFSRERDWSCGNYNYALTSVWKVWLIGPAKSDEKKRLHMTSKISEKLHLYETISDYKVNFQTPIVPFEIHFFRNGYRPKRSTPELVNGGILELQLQYSKKRSYKLWKDIVRFILDDNHVKFLNQEVSELRQRIVGLSFILTKHIRNDGSTAGKITVKFWAIPTAEGRRLSKSLVIDLCHLIQEGLPYDIGDKIGDILYIENQNSRTHRVFESSESGDEQSDDEYGEDDEDAV